MNNGYVETYFFHHRKREKYSIQRALKIPKIKLTYYFALCLKDQKSEVVLIERTSIEIKTSHTNNAFYYFQATGYLILKRPF